MIVFDIRCLNWYTAIIVFIVFHMSRRRYKIVTEFPCLLGHSLMLKQFKFKVSMKLSSFVGKPVFNNLIRGLLMFFKRNKLYFF